MAVETANIVVTNLVVAFGWFIVFKQALKVNHNQNISRVSSLATTTIDDIYNQCKNYYRASGDHISYESADIRAKFVLLSHYLILLRESGIETGISAALIQFKGHAMGGYFETIDYKRQLDLPNWKINLTSSAHELKFRIEKGQFDQSRVKASIFALK